MELYDFNTRCSDLCILGCFPSSYPFYICTHCHTLLCKSSMPCITQSNLFDISNMHFFCWLFLAYMFSLIIYTLVYFAGFESGHFLHFCVGRSHKYLRHSNISDIPGPCSWYSENIDPMTYLCYNLQYVLKIYLGSRYTWKIYLDSGYSWKIELKNISWFRI